MRFLSNTEEPVALLPVGDVTEIQLTSVVFDAIFQAPSTVWVRNPGTRTLGELLLSVMGKPVA